MTGYKKFSELTKDFSPERKARVKALADALRQEMTLQELREAFKLQQKELGERMGVKQAAISRMENRSDMYVSHLRKVIEAMGGELVLTARFPHADICINQVVLKR